MKLDLTFLDSTQNLNLIMNENKQSLDVEFDNVQVIHGGGVGQTTAEGGEIFNDYENNRAISLNTHVEGVENIAGAKAFNIIGMSPYTQDEDGNVIFEDNYYILDSTEGLAVGDIYSIKINNNYNRVGTIKQIDEQNKYVYVDALIKDELVKTPTVDGHYLISDANGNVLLGTNSNSFIVSDKPEIGTKNIGEGAHSEGCGTMAVRDYAHTEGVNTKAYGRYGHAEGNGTEAGHSAHAEGYGTKALGDYAHSEGWETEASGIYSHASGYQTVASGYGAYAEGTKTKSVGQGSHAEGGGSEATGKNAHAEGQSTKAYGNYSHSEGYNTYASKTAAHSEGASTQALGAYSHTEGTETKAYGENAHAEGQNSEAKGLASHTEGSECVAEGICAHAEGERTQATGESSHAEGFRTQALAEYSHAEGRSTIANYKVSHASGYNTATTAPYQTVMGRYTDASTNSLFTVGNGTYDIKRNAFEVLDDGRATIQTPPKNAMDVVNKQYVDELIGAGNNGLTQEQADKRYLQLPETVNDSYAVIPTRTPINTTVYQKMTEYAEGDSIPFRDYMGRIYGRSNWTNIANLNANELITVGMCKALIQEALTTFETTLANKEW